MKRLILLMSLFIGFASSGYALTINNVSLDGHPTTSTEKYPGECVTIDIQANNTGDEDIELGDLNHVGMMDSYDFTFGTEPGDTLEPSSDVFQVVVSGEKCIDEDQEGDISFDVSISYDGGTSNQETIEIDVLQSDDVEDDEGDLRINRDWSYKNAITKDDDYAWIEFSCNKSSTATTDMGEFVAPGSGTEVEVSPGQVAEIQVYSGDLDLGENQVSVSCETEDETDTRSFNIEKYVSEEEAEEAREDGDIDDDEIDRYTSSSIEMSGNLSAKTDHGQISLSWDKAETDNEHNFDQYRIYVFESGEDPSFAGYNYLTAIGDIDNTSWGGPKRNRHGVRLSEGDYDVYVVAFDRRGERSNSISETISIGEPEDDEDTWETISSSALLRSSRYSSYTNGERVFDQGKGIIFNRSGIRTFFEEDIRIGGINRDDNITQRKESWDADFEEELGGEVQQRIFLGVDERNLRFNNPLRIDIPVPEDGTYSVKAKHYGDDDWSTDGLSTESGSCNNGVAQDGKDTVVAEDRTATIYTCAASEFVVYGESDEEDEDDDVAPTRRGSGAIRQPNLDEIPDEIRERSETKEYVINGRTIEFKIPNFRNFSDMQSVELLIDLFIEEIEKRGVLGDDLYDAVSYFNEFLFYLKMFKDYDLSAEDLEEARRNARTSANKFMEILGKYDEITIPESIDDVELEDALKFMYEKGLTKYDNAAEYGLYRNLLREESSRMFSQFAKEVLEMRPNYSRNCSFSDIGQADGTLVEYIRQVCYLGIMRGSQEKFWPKNQITRAEFITVLIRSTIGDMNEDHDPWWIEYWAVAVSEGVSENESQEQMEEPITRYEAALMFYRTYNELAD
ncbi:S-layer homology domain-containing protein [Candidatus Absconditicoccus praedator]|uniref:S-layer homology domain-containing protein n=1 Tax=Candidatus Absconditicoccus praedator TaxID=2735562 RepID=UPI001E575D4C|nr:hypothetical protein [Candidatus Absconditicoccus praedator]UFX83375.1 hypothetical protein HLG78_04570 [Candidatus Absconditicoccus praedator]